MAYSDVTRPHRWASKVSKSDACWEWTGYRTASGYGMFRWATGRRVTAHRAAFLLHVGPIPDGMEIDHLCRNRGCVNPAHLQLVTHAENCARADSAKGVRLPNGRKTHCARGHAYAGDNLRTGPDGKRACRTCNRQAMRRHRVKRRAVVGSWWAACCIEDLYQIESEDDVTQIIEWTHDEDGIMIAGIWPTKDAAIAALGGIDTACARTRARLA